MEKGEMVAESLSSDPDKSIYFDWTPYLQPDLKKSYPTLVSRANLEIAVKHCLSFPEDLQMQKQVQKMYSDREKMLKGELRLEEAHSRIDILLLRIKKVERVQSHLQL